MRYSMALWSKYDAHWNKEHKLECDKFQSAFAKESTLKYHNQEWYCEACKSKVVCYWEFTDHGNLDHWSIKIWDQIEQQKITLEAFEKVDEASADREHNVDDTLLKKPMLQTGSNEEIENCSMHSEDISNDDIESLEELSHKVDIKG